MAYAPLKPHTQPMTLTERLKVNAWKPPNPQQPGPPPAYLDSFYPFQACCCEVCGSICSPLMLNYRDNTTIMYRVQQHCRKLVPKIIQTQVSGDSSSAVENEIRFEESEKKRRRRTVREKRKGEADSRVLNFYFSPLMLIFHVALFSFFPFFFFFFSFFSCFHFFLPSFPLWQSHALSSSRSAQRGVLDVTDSLSMIDVLNGPVASSFLDISNRANNCARILGEMERQRKEEEKKKERRMKRQMDAESSLPTTPTREDQAAAASLASSSSSSSSAASSVPSDSVFHAHNVSLASVAPSLAPTPSRRTLSQLSSPSAAGGGSNQQHGFSAASPRSQSMSSASTTPRHATASQLRSRLSNAFSSSSSSSSSSSNPSLPPPVLVSTVAEEDHHTTSSIDHLHPSLTLANPHDQEHEHSAAPVKENSISPFVP